MREHRHHPHPGRHLVNRRESTHERAGTRHVGASSKASRHRPSFLATQAAHLAYPLGRKSEVDPPSFNRIYYDRGAGGNPDHLVSHPPCSTACYARGVAREITQRELRNNSGDIMRQLDVGESFTVTRNGVPVGELTPLRRHRFVTAETAVAAFRMAPHIDYERFRDDLDSVAAQDSTPRG